MLVKMNNRKTVELIACNYYYNHKLEQRMRKQAQNDAMIKLMKMLCKS